MSRLAIFGYDDNKVIKDFIRIHGEMLAGEKILVSQHYGEPAYQGRILRCFYSRHPARAKLAKLLPHFLYHRWVIRREREAPARLDTLAGFFRAHDVDVVLAEFGTTGASLCTHTRQLGIPLIVHFHGHDAHRRSLLTEARVKRYREMFDTAFRIVAVSRLMESTLLEMGCPREKLVYNPYGPRDRFFAIEPDYRPTVLSVGRFCDIKANYLVLLAFRKALHSCPDARLVMVGDGELLETCRTLAEVWNMEDRVSFPGAIPHGEVDRLFAEACCFAQHSITPTYGDAEGTPNTILEAGAAALPVVSTRHAGIPDVVIEGTTGLLVDERDVDGMADHLVTLLSDSDRARAMGQAAREHIRENYPIQRHVDCLDRLIAEARASHDGS